MSYCPFVVLLSFFVSYRPFVLCLIAILFCLTVLCCVLPSFLCVLLSFVVSYCPFVVVSCCPFVVSDCPLLYLTVILFLCLTVFFLRVLVSICCIFMSFVVSYCPLIVVSYCPLLCHTVLCCACCPSLCLAVLCPGLLRPVHHELCPQDRRRVGAAAAQSRGRGVLCPGQRQQPQHLLDCHRVRGRRLGAGERRQLAEDFRRVPVQDPSGEPDHMRRGGSPGKDDDNDDCVDGEGGAADCGGDHTHVNAEGQPRADHSVAVAPRVVPHAGDYCVRLSEL